ncbi:MAG: hypothetical protein JJT75_11580 [Opitutales bacterium]|nr:hypothetical protein [Opitutales bacterium]MCH8539991.1 hypothetical protein [Opitutales bacterium]
MAETPADKNKKLTQSELSNLQNLQFGPDWTSERKATDPAPRSGEGRRSSGRPPAKGGPRQDRRPPRRDRETSRREMRPKPFRPALEVQVHPTEKVFQTLAKAMRETYQTYELFELAQLILSKPERHEFFLKPFPDTESGLFLAVPDEMPFFSENAAIEHVMAKHLDKFFSTEEIELEAPKGNFQFVSRCPWTKNIIGPPNYHLYPQLLRDHHATHLPGMDFERFRQKLETLRDEESVQTWVESMKKGMKYSLKEEFHARLGSDSPKEFTSLEEVRQSLSQSLGDQVFRKVRSHRISGTKLDEITEEPIKKSIEFALSRQERFPMDIANVFRAKFRRQQFHVYKKGSKGVSFACAVRRKLRQPNQIFSETIQSLIRFLEENPEIQASQLPEKYLGQKIPKTEEEKKALSSNPAFKTMLIDLRWLLAEGYVVEYSDGRLHLPPVEEPPPPKKPKTTSSNEKEADLAPSPATADPEDANKAAAPEPSSPNAAEATPEKPEQTPSEESPPEQTSEK